MLLFWNLTFGKLGRGPKGIVEIPGKCIGYVIQWRIRYVLTTDDGLSRMSAWVLQALLFLYIEENRVRKSDNFLSGLEQCMNNQSNDANFFLPAKSGSDDADVEHNCNGISSAGRSLHA